MDVKVLTRHFEPPVDIKETVAGKLSGLVEKHFANATESSVVISLENSCYQVDILVKIKGISFHAHDENHQLLQCTDNALKKIEVQLKRYKEKMISSGRKNKQSR